MSEERKPWEMPTYEYIGNARLPAPDSGIVQAVYKAATEGFAKIKERVSEGDLILGEERVPVCDGYSFTIMTPADPKNSGVPVFVLDATDEIVGSPRVGMMSPYVVPEHRGKGIVSGFHWLRDMEGKATRTLGYTPEGLESRAAAHKLHVERALERGDIVPDEVLSEYLINEDGKVSRPERYTPEVYNAEQERRRNLVAEDSVDFGM